MIVATPSVLISASAILLIRNGASHFYALGLSSVYLAFGTWAYYDAIYVHPDPQNGLVFVVVPILGIIVAVVGAGVALAIARGRSQSRAPKHDA